MKLTWFGGTTIRVHIGGVILVVDPAGAPVGIDRTELVSGADRVFNLDGDGMPSGDAATWKPRRAGRLLDEDGTPPQVLVWAFGGGSVLVDAVDERPLLLVGQDVPKLGRWGSEAVIVLFGDGAQLAGQGMALLEVHAPKAIALAGDEDAIDFAIDALREKLDGTGLFYLEPGMALEI